MRCLVIAVVIALTTARPDTYREKEDFQYSRSSSDEGSKSGYYGAQRGNMGGNYERAHNMDTLAQHQMSGLIHQVDGEVGDTSNTKSGNVFTSANSRGMYGSGHYDLSNLEGRNFQEGVSSGHSSSQSALSNSAYRDHASGSHRYSNSNSYSHSSTGHSNYERSEYGQHEGIQSSNLRSGDNTYQQEYGAYDDSARLSNSGSSYQNRLVSTRPMRILIRPGTRVTIPIATQTFDADHSATSYDSSTQYPNFAKSDAEIIANNKQVPENKHYESSYSYHKEWEKRHSSPGAVPLGINTDSSKTSELYDDSQHTQAYNSRKQNYASSAADSQSRHSSNVYGYNTKNNLASSSHSQQQSEYDVQREKLSSDMHAFTNNEQQSNFDTDYANQQHIANSKPKSYQSSYSYHKSWERQGDPYVIVPVPGVQNGQASQRLSSASNSHSGYSSHQHGSNHKHSHNSYSNNNRLMDCDCDEDDHIRVARSYDVDQEAQQSQNGWEDYGQQSQNLWDDHTETDSHVQQTQNQWDKFEDVGQQTERKRDKNEDIGQETQNSWNKLDDLGQQSEHKWEKIEDLGQQTQNKWDKIEDLGQQTQNTWDNIEDLGQQPQNHWDKIQDMEQQSQNHWGKIEDLGQQPQIEDLGQQTQNHWDTHNQFDQQSQSNVDQEQGIWDKLEKSHKQSNTNSFQSQEASVSLFEDKPSDIFPSQDTSSTKLLQDNDRHIHHFNKDLLLFNHNINNYEKTQNNNKDTVLNVEQSSQQNSFIPVNTLSDSHHTSINTLWKKLDRLDRESSVHNNFYTNEHNSLPDKSTSLEENTTMGIFKESEKTAINVHPKDIGRGDIGPEDTELDAIENQTFVSNTSYDNTDKNGKDIAFESHHKHSEDLSNNNSENVQASIISINNQTLNNQVREHNLQESINVDQESINVDKTDESRNKQHLNLNLNEYIENFDQEHDNFDQQNMAQDIQFSGLSSDCFNETNLNQNLEDFNLLHENLDQHNTNHIFDTYKHNNDFNQQSMTHNIEKIHSSKENLDQHNEQEHHMQNFDKQTKYSDYQNSNENFSRLNENNDEQTINHGYEDFIPQIRNLDQKNIEEYLHDFSKPTDKFDQQNLNQYQADLSNLAEDFNQESVPGFHQQTGNLAQQDSEQDVQSFDKHSESFDQQYLNQNLEHFSQFDKNFEQNNQDIDEALNNEWDPISNKYLSLNNINRENSIQKINYHNQEQKKYINIINDDNENVFRNSRHNFGQQNLHSSFETSNQERDVLVHNVIPSNSDHSPTAIHQNKEVIIPASMASIMPSPSLESKETIIVSTVAPEPKHTGFWSSVGKKFGKAKDKVVSWFRKTE